MSQEIKNKTKEITQDQILVNTVHEIRTPVQTIIGTLDLLYDTNLSNEQKDYVRQIHFGADVLLALVNDILDYSKINSHKMSLENISFDVKTLTEETVQLISMDGFRKNLEVICDVAPSIPDLILGDSKRIQQILLNLIKNAIKFTKEGYIHIELSQKEENVLLFKVTDSGIGIDIDNKDKIFESYYQGDSSISREYGGTGLGLAISKGLVEMMKGEIGVDPNPYGGSIFWFTIPFQTVKENQVSMYHIPVPANTKVLIVDDNNLAAGSLKTKLNSLGIQNTRSATNAKETLLTLKYAIDLEEPFDIVFIDMHMPVFDGWNLAEDIRKTPRMSKTKLFLMVPEGLMGKDGITKINEIFDGFIYKPVQTKALEKLFEGTYKGFDSDDILTELESIDDDEDKNKNENHDEKQDETGKPKTKVLVAEDHSVNRRILTEFLKKLNCEVYEAENGREAVESIKKHPSIQVVFMDIQMPEIHGIEATKMLRQDKFAGIIIACTANNDRENFSLYVKNGMNDVLVKPFKKENVKALLDKWDSVLSLPVAPDIAFFDSNIIMNNELWDTDDFEDTISGDWNLGRQILYDYIEQTKRLIGELDDAANKNDFEEINKIAHTIKGSSAAISANKLNFIGDSIGKAAKSKDISGVKKHIETFKKEFDTFLMVSGKWEHLKEDEETE